jgi:hypothetical protein
LGDNRRRRRHCRIAGNSPATKPIKG